MAERAHEDSWKGANAAIDHIMMVKELSQWKRKKKTTTTRMSRRRREQLAGEARTVPQIAGIVV